MKNTNTKILKVFEQYIFIIRTNMAALASPPEKPRPLAWAGSASASSSESAVGASETAAAQQPAVQQRKPTDATKRQNTAPQAHKTELAASPKTQSE